MKLYNILELLEKHTSGYGSYSLGFNEHNVNYPKTAEDVRSYYIMNEEDIEGYEDVDWSKNIYSLHWYNRNQVGQYYILSNTIERLYEHILEIVGDDK